jgi:hypothetical protein
MQDKHEWRKKEKAIYTTRKNPEIIDVPTFQYITLSGEGSPASPIFTDIIGTLYSLSYAIKMTLKKSGNPPLRYTDYTVYPLEGVWDINEEAKTHFSGNVCKDDFIYTLMIRQPAFVSHDFFNQILSSLSEKKPNRLLNEVKLESISEGKCIQMLHIGKYDDEPNSFNEMEAFAASKGMIRLSKVHREVYLSDARKVEPDKLKTILRFKIK